MYKETLPWVVNYNAAEIPPYTIPDVLTCQDGTMVGNKEQWEAKRRPELLEIFRKYMYGQVPPKPDKVEYDLLTEKKDALGGIAIRREVRITFRMNDGRFRSFVTLAYIPAGAKGKVPVFVGLTFMGNHVITNEEVMMTGMSYPLAPDKQVRGLQTFRFPLEYLMGRGYAIVVASYNDIFPDRSNGWADSMYNLFFSKKELENRLDDYSSIGLWSWGLSHMLDMLETMPEIDTSRAAVFGHSRLGKTSLWTGAQDTRFKLVCVNDSGCGGAALSRRLYGETLYSMVKHNNIGYWFCNYLCQHSLHPEDLPFEQHQLISLVAPRAVSIHSATEDQWADPTSEYYSAFNAGPVYSLYGKTPLANPEPPAPDTPVGTDVSYFLRTGKHNLLAPDWMHYLDLADIYLK